MAWWLKFTLPWPNQSKIWRNLEFLRVSYGVAHPTISWLKFQVWPRPYKIHQNPTILKEHQVIAPKWRFKILHVMQNNWGHGKPHDERLLTRLASRSSSFQKNHSTNQTSSCFLFLIFYPRSISTSEDPRSTVFYTANPFVQDTLNARTGENVVDHQLIPGFPTFLRARVSQGTTKNHQKNRLLKAMALNTIPSGKLSHNYGKPPFLMGKSTINDNFP